MNKLTSLLLVAVITSPLFAQVEQPKVTAPKKAAIKFKATAPPTVKAGDHIVVDSSSAGGDVFFFYDEVAFPKNRATQFGKVLVLSTPTNGTYTIYVASLEDKAKEKIVVTVTGGEPAPKPTDPPPVPTDPLEQIKASIDTLNRSVNKLAARVEALEKTPPVDPPKKSVIAHLTFVLTDAGSSTVSRDKELRAYLKGHGIKVWEFPSNDPFLKKSGLDKAVAEAGGAPCFVIQEADMDGKAKVLGQSSAKTVAGVQEYLKTWLGD